MPSKTIEEHLREEIAKTGYPLEIEISDLLDEEWFVFNNDSYLDLEEHKSREIDIFAIHKSEPDQLLPEKRPVFYGITELVVECKKRNTHAWIFFTRPRKYNWVGDGQIIDPVKIRTGGKDQLVDLSLLDLHYGSFDRHARTYSEVKLQGESSGKSEIFEASNQLINCVRYHVNEHRELMLRDSSRHQIGIYFLVVAFDGKLYEAIVKGGDVSLYPRESMLLSANRHWITGPQSYSIDVVTKQHFSEYLNALDVDVEKFRNYLASEENSILSRMRKESQT